MSEYHKKCVPEPPPSKNKNTILTSKAFCDCKICTCRNCPDIIKMLGITVTDTDCDFGLKVPASNDDISLGDSESFLETMKILDVVNQERKCNCSVVARGLQDHVHTNLGLSNQHENMQNIETCDDTCQAFVHGEGCKQKTTDNGCCATKDPKGSCQRAP